MIVNFTLVCMVAAVALQFAMHLLLEARVKRLTRELRERDPLDACPRCSIHRAQQRHDHRLHI